ncbi:hypothetical protein LSH36_40g08075 [Paralvinella palmiformis]|uniref:rRNA methyltransferase 1, mitochondrial n=1 Tax=Paralvinella palmiformis TaxID=53620 RepID=A0AAD9NDR1_9ANNE|nr:hypothetical protein LSH36_40g08075 [Paralvinella palmiformis]
MALIKNIRVTVYGNSTGSRKQSSKHATYLQDRQKELIRKPKVRGQMIYGKFPIVTALQTRKRTIYQLYLKSNLWEERDDRTADVIDDIINLANDNQIPIEAVSKYILNLLVDDPMQGLRQHQGICADVSPLHYIPVDLGDEREMGQVPKVWLVIQSVQDPNNFGALLRSAYYLGVDRIIAFNRQIIFNSYFRLVCRGYRWQVFGTTGLSSEDQNRILLPEVKIDRDVIVVLGNEGYGLSDDISSLCDKMITIPSRNEQQHTMLANGMLDSLNVSVASGIILHHLVNNRKRS